MVFENMTIGPIRINKNNRRTVNVYDSRDQKSIEMLYSRYLMCIKEDRILSPDEEVDHIDDNPFNDDIENLQIISMSMNIIKSKVETFVTSKCPVCSRDFETNLGDYKRRIDRSQNGYILCSRGCIDKKISLISSGLWKEPFPYEDDGEFIFSVFEMGWFSDHSKYDKILDSNNVRHNRFSSIDNIELS